MNRLSDKTGMSERECVCPLCSGEMTKEEMEIRICSCGVPCRSLLIVDLSLVFIKDTGNRQTMSSLPEALFEKRVAPTVGYCFAV